MYNSKATLLAILDKTPHLFSEKEIKFMTLTFGLAGEREHTLREIAKALDITSSDVIKLYKSIIKKSKRTINNSRSDSRSSFFESIGMPIRAIRALHSNNVFDLNELSSLSKSDLLKMRGIGVKTIAEIEAKAYEFGIVLKSNTKCTDLTI